MMRRWLLSEVVTAVFLCILVIIFLSGIVSRHPDKKMLVGVIWTSFGIAMTAYCGKNRSSLRDGVRDLPLAFGVSSIFFGLAVALAPMDLLRDIVLLAFLAIICISVIVCAAWLRRLLMREVWI